MACPSAPYSIRPKSLPSTMTSVPRLGPGLVVAVGPDEPGVEPGDELVGVGDGSEGASTGSEVDDVQPGINARQTISAGAMDDLIHAACYRGRLRGAWPR